LAYKLVLVLITSILGVRSHRRFMRIINISRNLKTGATAIVERLAYFRDMNAFLTIILFIYGTSLCILCVDGFTTAETINNSKFAADLLIANCNTAVVLMWIVCVCIALD
jgi:ribosomal protein L2